MRHLYTRDEDLVRNATSRFGRRKDNPLPVFEISYGELLMLSAPCTAIPDSSADPNRLVLERDWLFSEEGVAPVADLLARHRGRRGDPLYQARRALHTGEDLLTDTNGTAHGAVHQRRTCAGRGDLGCLPAARRCLPRADRARGRQAMQDLIEFPHRRHARRAGRGPQARADPHTSRAHDVLATSTDPTPATARPRPSTVASNTSEDPPRHSGRSWLYRVRRP